MEDDFLNRRLSKKILSSNGYRVFEAKNAKETFEILHKERLDLLVLDIHLGEREENGIQIAQAVQQYALPFVYLTAYDTPEMLRQAIATKPVSYLTKPYKDIDLLASVEIALRQPAADAAPPVFVLVKDGDFNLKLPVHSIDYIESDGNYLFFHAGKKVYKSRGTIKQILQELPESDFLQTHRAYVVNRQKIEKFSSKGLLVGDFLVPVSKGFADITDKI